MIENTDTLKLMRNYLSERGPQFFGGIKKGSSISMIFSGWQRFLAIQDRRIAFFSDCGQLGFLAGNRTSDAHIILYNLINDYCHKRGLKLYGCFVDFSKAFDSIPRDKMFKKLLDIGITGKFYNIIKFIYEGDQICLKINDSITPAIRTMMGVRQGCVLSPLLFNIFMADFARTLSSDIGVHITDNERINCILWADDIILLSETEEGLNKLLNQVKLYSDQNKLKVSIWGIKS